MNMEISNDSCCGLILGAGRSSRMGAFKLDLPWKDTTVLGNVVRNLEKGGISRFFVVYNPHRKPIDPPGLPDVEINWIANKVAETEEMLVSIQTGLKALPEEIEYAFICLGDQPEISPEVVRKLLDELSSVNSLIIPSYRMRRGHPWVVKRNLWPGIIELKKDTTVRSFIEAQTDHIHYVLFDMERPEDLDTPDDYQRLHERMGKLKINGS